MTPRLSRRTGERMTYELAKQLKDAGFPQRRKEGKWIPHYGWKDREITRAETGEIVKQVNGKYDSFYAPTLSELIEACGIRFYGLELHIDKYLAIGKSSQSGTWQYWGETPEEAVAKLWLLLKS